MPSQALPSCVLTQSRNLLALSIDLCTLTPLRIPQLRLQLGQPPNSGRSHHSGPSPVRVAFGAMKKCISDKKTDVCLQVLGGHICTLQQGPQLGGWYVVITFNPGCASTSSSPLPFYDFMQHCTHFLVNQRGHNHSASILLCLPLSLSLFLSLSPSPSLPLPLSLSLSPSPSPSPSPSRSLSLLEFWKSAWMYWLAVGG